MATETSKQQQPAAQPPVTKLSIVGADGKINRAFALKALENMESFMQDEVKTEKPSSSGAARATMLALVLEVSKNDYGGAVTVILQNPAKLYDTSTEILNGKGIRVAVINKPEDTVTVYFGAREGLEADKEKLIKAQKTIVDNVGSTVSRTFCDKEKVRMTVDKKCTLPTCFSVVEISVSMTKYLSEPKAGSTLLPSIEVSCKIMSLNTICFSNQIQTTEMFRKTPKALNIPIGTLVEIFKESDYIHTRQLSGKVVDQPAARTYYVPLCSKEESIDIFGGDFGCMTSFNFDRNDPQKSPVSFEQRKGADQGKRKICARFIIELTQWNSLNELLPMLQPAAKRGSPKQRRYLMTGMFFESSLGFCKISDLNLWEAMAEAVFRVPMFLPLCPLLYQTAENAMNKLPAGGWSDGIEKPIFFDCGTPNAPIVDFVGHLIKSDSTIEVSAHAALRMVSEKKLGTILKRRNVFDDRLTSDSAFYNLNECEEAAANSFFTADKLKQFRFIVLVEDVVGTSARAVLTKLRNYVLEHPTEVGGEVLLWEKWDGTNAADYITDVYSDFQFSGETPPAFPPTHVLLQPDNKIEALRKGTKKFILYAVNIVDRQRVEKESISDKGELIKALTATPTPKTPKPVVPLLEASPSQLQATPTLPASATGSTSSTNTPAVPVKLPLLAELSPAMSLDQQQQQPTVVIQGGKRKLEEMNKADETEAAEVEALIQAEQESKRRKEQQASQATIPYGDGGDNDDEEGWSIDGNSVGGEDS